MDSYNPRKTHEWFGFMSKPSNENRVIFTPNLRLYWVLPATLSGGHKTRPYDVEMGRGRQSEDRIPRKTHKWFGFMSKTIKQKPGYIHARPAAVLGITCDALGRAQDPPLRCD